MQDKRCSECSHSLETPTEGEIICIAHPPSCIVFEGNIRNVFPVMMGWGKGASYHGYEYFGCGIQPDISALAKSLVAGYYPLGAAVANKKVTDVINQPKAWKFGHTWQPPVGGICGMKAVYDHIEEHNLLDKVHWIQPHLTGLATNLMDKEIITEYRSNGTILFMKFNKDIRQSGMSQRDMLRI